MATTASFTKSTKSNDKKSANGFINLIVVDAEGTEHKLRGGVALYNDNNLENSIMVAAAKAAKAGKEFTLTLKATVNILVPEADKKPVKF